MSTTPRKLGKGLLLLGLLVSLSACETTGQKQNFGAILGAAGGGLLGSTLGSGSGRLAATAAGAALGGLFGSETGKSLDRADSAYARQYPRQHQGNTSQVPLAPPAGYPAYTAPPAYSSAIPPAQTRSVSPQTSGVQPFGGSSPAPASCKPLVGEPGSRIAYACQSLDGNWFIAR